MTVVVRSDFVLDVKNELSKTPMSLRLFKRSQARISDLQSKCGVKAADIVRVAIDDYLENNPSAEQVIRAVIKMRART